MKKVLLIFFAVAFATSMCFAEDASVLSSTDNSANSTQASGNDIIVPVPKDTAAPTQPASATPAASIRTTTFTGTVDSVSSDANPQIIAKDDSGQQTIFAVADDATIIGKDGNPTSLSWVDSGDKASIEYITNKDDTKTAKSIKIQTGW